MDYHGTAGDDTIDQKALGIADGSSLWGGAGNDTITFGVGTAVGEAGNDTLVGTSAYSGVAYWNSPAGIVADLKAGTVKDGFGGTDTLRNIRVIQDSNWDDRITGGGASEEFWLSRGSDTVIGGGGTDTAIFYNLKSTEVSVTYDRASDTFTVVKHTTNGDTGTDKLTGISRISFIGPQSDNAAFTRDMFDDSSGFLRTSTLPSFDMGKVEQMRAGDFNGDGKVDLLVVRANVDFGLTAEPLQILVGDGAGHFTDQTASLFQGGVIPKINYVPRIFAADFNKDGITDIFTPDFGVDAPPFPGGQNSLFLSSPATHLLENATATLPQALRQNHGTSLGDVNHDGYVDILVNALHETTGNGNQLLINDGTGHFVVSQQLLPPSLHPNAYAPGYTWSMLRDLNNDGYDDMVLGTWDPNPGPSLVVLNDGHGSFANATPIALPRSGFAQETVIGIETINLNGDALPDLVLSVTNDGARDQFYKVPYIQFLVNDGNGHFHDETALRLPQSQAISSAETNWYKLVTPVDLNGDGFQDLVTDGSNAYGASRVFMNDGTGKFTPGWQGGSYVHVLPVDVNGDGKIDLVESSESGFSVLLNSFPNQVPASGVYHAGDGGERIAGGAARETIYNGKGNDTIDGGGGLDTVVYSGSRAGFKVAKSATGFTVNGAQGSDTLAQVERLAFSDVSVALDIDGIGGQAYRIYKAAFNRAPDGGGLGFWISAMDHGSTLNAVAEGFVQSKEFHDLYGAAPTNREIVSKLYANILERAGETAGIDFWVGVLDAKNATVAEVLAGFSESNENKLKLVGVTENGVDYVPFG
jgi:hypothetical protein